MNTNPLPRRLITDPVTLRQYQQVNEGLRQARLMAEAAKRAAEAAREGTASAAREEVREEVRAA